MSSDSHDVARTLLCAKGCGFYGSRQFDGMCSKCYKDTIKQKQAPPSSTTGASTTTNCKSQTTVVSTGANNTPSSLAAASLEDKRRCGSSPPPPPCGYQPTSSSTAPTSSTISSSSTSSSDSPMSSVGTTPAGASVEDALTMRVPSAHQLDQGVGGDASSVKSEGTPMLQGSDSSDLSSAPPPPSGTASDSSTPMEEPDGAATPAVATATPSSTDSATPASSATPTKLLQKKPNRCDICNKKLPPAVQLKNKCRCERIFCDAHRSYVEHSCTYDYKANPIKMSAAVAGTKLNKI